MTNTIQVKKKTVYGTERIYILSEHKEAVKTLTGQETLSLAHVEALKKLGFIFELEQEKI